MRVMKKPCKKTHSARPGEPLSLCGAPAWLVAIVPAVVEPTCATCRRIRSFRKSSKNAGSPRVP